MKGRWKKKPVAETEHESEPTLYEPEVKCRLREEGNCSCAPDDCLLKTSTLKYPD